MLAQWEYVDPKSITRNLRRSAQFEPLRHYCAGQGALLQSDRRILRWLAGTVGQVTRYRLLLDRRARLSDLLEATV